MKNKFQMKTSGAHATLHAHDERNEKPVNEHLNKHDFQENFKSFS